MQWHVYIDGASSGNPGESGAGIMIFDEGGREILRESIYLGKMTNNMAEYEALIRALKKAKKFLIQNITVYTDSLLVANQVLGRYKVKNARLKQNLEEAKNIIRNFDRFIIQYIPRKKKALADKLAKEAIKKGVDG